MLPFSLRLCAGDCAKRNGFCPLTLEQSLVLWVNVDAAKVSIQPFCQLYSKQAVFKSYYIAADTSSFYHLQCIW